MSSGPHAKSMMQLAQLCAHMSINNIPDHGHVHTYVHRANRSPIQSLVLMHLAIITFSLWCTTLLM